MHHDSPADYRDWMRGRFPDLNKSIDDGNTDDLSTLLHESLALCRHIEKEPRAHERELYTYLTMVHSALWHHALSHPARSHDVSAEVNEIESMVLEFASRIGVEHRFLSVFYLFYNPELPDLRGRFAQFRPLEYETAFIRINKEGTLQYTHAAKALWKAYRMLETGNAHYASLHSLLDLAVTSFRKISHGNSMLLQTPGGEEFRFITQYFGAVEIAGKTLRGVNAGDQPWPYMIDLLLGVDLKGVFERSFEGTSGERRYPPAVRTSADMVRYEFDSGRYLHPKYFLPEDYEELVQTTDAIERTNDTLLLAIRKRFSGAEQLELARTLREVMKHYLAASNVHWQLARRHVPKNAAGEQIGSAGTNIVTFLRDGLNAERENVKNDLERLYPELFHSERERTTA